MRSPLMAFGLVALLAVLPGSAAAGLITNGDFETGNLSGWTISGPGASETSNYGVAHSTAHTGSWGAWFGTVSGLVYISQIIPTTPGGSYVVSGWLSNFDGGSHVNRFELWWNGGLIDSFTNDGAFSYGQGIYNVTATSSSTEVKLGFQNPPGYWRFDDAAVDPIPEPSGLLLCGSGLVLLTVLFRRRMS